ncbi:MAG TPA: hypothetical protein VHK70_00845 [Burkholderiaceae bacterium]|jgi:hypothetical protein|nr:hypothetical protein [Burkholderiaceae bacterium]
MAMDERLLTANLTPAKISGLAAAEQVWGAVSQRWPWLKHWFADGRTRLLDKITLLDRIIEVVRKLRHRHEFVPLPRCGVVERTFG